MTECIFVAGVHGVGKSSLCEILKTSGFPVYSASDLIRRISNCDAGLYKRVADPLKNQDILLEAVERFVHEPKYILDGHFVVRRTDGRAYLIEPEIFLSLNVKKSILLTDSPASIGRRLRKRDNSDITDSQIAEMQEFEVRQAKSICLRVGAQLLCISPAQQAVALALVLQTFA